MVNAAPPGHSRIVALDLARTLALIGMAVFHFTWDLEFFGYITPGTTLQGGWAIFARLVAASFLFLVGVSLVLAHGDGIRWPGFLRRLAMIAGAAALITAATAYAVPHAFIFFGMLHSIAVASVLGLLFLRAPPWLLLAAAVAVWLLPALAASPAFDTRWLAWTGLAATPPASFDFVPVTPWFTATLAGIAFARGADRAGLWTRLRAREPGPLLRALAWPGRHSLAVYLLHQPVLLGLLWLFSRVTG
jgi:uncharacterized membrane protein